MNVPQRSRLVKSGVTIRENDERLVDVRKFCPNVLIRLGQKRLKLEKTAYLRETVAQMLREATGYLPPGLRFVINDAWRPAYVQCAIFFDFIRQGKKRYPGLQEKALIKEIQKYVAPWKGVDASGHMSGGAIDLRIVDKRGQRIPMRSARLDYRQNALSHQPLLPKLQQKNRAILVQAMRRADFSNYPLEFWHWSYGDYQWAKRNRIKVAKYAAVADVNNTYAHSPCPCQSGKEFTQCHGKE